MCEVWHNQRRRLYTNLLTAKAIAYRDWRYTTGNDKKKRYIYIYYMYLHKRVWTRSYSQINYNSSAFLAVNGAFSRSRSSILAMLKLSSATYCSFIRRLTGDRVKRVCSSSLLLLLLDGGGGGAVAAASRLLGVGRPVSVGVADAVGVAATATDADGDDVTYSITFGNSEGAFTINQNIVGFNKAIGYFNFGIIF